MFDPVRLAAAVHGDGRVSELFEAPGDGVAAGASAGAVHDDRRLPVGQQRPCQSVDVAWGDVDGAGWVGVGVVRNEVQYRATKGHLERFEQAAANLAAQEPARQVAPTRLDAVNAQADDLRAEIADYEQLRSGQVLTFTAATLAELATVLVKARVARGWTQRQLADALGVAEQQIQRYEANGYRSTSLARRCDIADALGVQVEQRAELKPSLRSRAQRPGDGARCAVSRRSTWRATAVPGDSLRCTNDVPRQW